MMLMVSDSDCLSFLPAPGHVLPDTGGERLRDEGFIYTQSSPAAGWSPGREGATLGFYLENVLLLES